MDDELPIRCLEDDDLPEAARRDLAERARWSDHATGEQILGFDASPRLLVVCSGYVKLSAVSPAGYRRAPLILRSGDAIDVHLFHPRNVSEFDVTALSPCRIGSILEADLRAVSRRHPEVWQMLAGRFAEQIEELIERWVWVSSEEVVIRLSRILLDLSSDGETGELVDLEIPLTHDTMAELVAASRPHVSSVLADLEHSGAVRRHLRRPLQVRPAALRDLVIRGETQHA